MKKRNPAAVFLFGLITFGLYAWYWAVKTKGEMNKLGEKVPTAWIWLIPFVGAIWWYWKYSEAVEHVTHEKLNGVLAFILLFLLGIIGQAVIQDYFNKIDVAAATTPAAPMPPAPQPVSPSAPTIQPASPVEATPTQQPPTTFTPPNPPVVSG